MTSSKGHFLHGVDFPVYALAWTKERQLAVTGGGGAGRSGVKNSIVRDRSSVSSMTAPC